MDKKVILEQYKIDEADLELIDNLAMKVVEWGMTAPVILFVETMKPLTFIGSQLLVFIEPFVHTIFNFKEYNRIYELLENRENVELFLQRLEYFDSERIKEEKKNKEENKKNAISFLEKVKSIFKKKDKNGA